ncbi:helix-turn-helix domain-containing protein [Lacrimispora saccharolytica]|uniref:Transcriptional regulator, XRE family n=1 Tax=Lacrimispora saccharolytica (strain ATCC 35040 / DSM 2544 / NRCC 2533 / WM1) TaxID=610130 RepID=D9R5C5_LACSW|nr:helix-turn-helix transcriptional regulator [Lacrimispora saccharolytica]ADL03331.1 transcriptional regulator, XRE family [[Clostridium] saccharolyticum WM1]QRV18509.1 helix-turn-helix transcriptional regulator [Lacrimispora saccharolytica]
MNNRIKEVRKKLGLSQEEFGKRLRVTKTSISKIEAGINNPSDQTIKLICSEFSVNEEWLRTGAGGQDNMFLSEDVKYIQNIGKLGTEKNDFKKFCLNMIMGLPDEYWDYIYKEFKKFDKEISNDDSGDLAHSVNSLMKDLPRTPEEFEKKYQPVDKNSKEVQDWIAKMRPTPKH